MDYDVTLDDVLRSAYRLSWPEPAPQAAPEPDRRPALLGMLPFGRRQPLHGWAIPLSAPTA
jgi:hypothetical protein